MHLNGARNNMDKTIRPLTSESQRVRYNLKDSLFVSFFRERDNVLQFYREMYPDDSTVTKDDIDLKTLNNIVVSGPINDLGFIVKDKMMLLVEAQSYYLPSVLLRSFVYLISTLERYLKERGIDVGYADESEVPNWVIYIIFTKGSRYKDRDSVLKFDSIGSNFFDLSQGKEISVKDDGIVHEYIQACTTIDSIISEYGHGKDAVEKVFDALEVCKGALGDFIRSRRFEIMGLYEELFDNEEATRVRIRHSNKIAREEGREEGRQESARNYAIELVKDGTFTAEQASVKFNVPLEELKALLEEKDIN